LFVQVGQTHRVQAAGDLRTNRHERAASLFTGNKVRITGSRARSASSIVSFAGVILPIIAETFRQVVSRPLAYCSIPLVAALVGYGTNWVGVKMIFYPMNFLGLNIYRFREKGASPTSTTDFKPLGLFGWQGIVPTKAKKMGRRLTDVVTRKLLSMRQSFKQLDAVTVAKMMEPTVLDRIRRDQGSKGDLTVALLQPFMRETLTQVVRKLQVEIEDALDLSEVVSSAFIRDKLLLVELFQKVGRKELEFLVNSGFSFGFLLGIFQMLLWVLLPNGWVLSVGGALVGYITNWVAIKLIFEPVEPTRLKIGPIRTPFVLQGLFEKRQKEVSEEFAHFLATRILTSQRLLQEVFQSQRFEAIVNEAIPPWMPAFVMSRSQLAESCLKAARGISEDEKTSHPLPQYVEEGLLLQSTLKERLQALPAAEFEDLLHPVFQEDEITLIIAGGVLGFWAGSAQQAASLGGPMTAGSIATVLQRKQSCMAVPFVISLLTTRLRHAGRNRLGRKPTEKTPLYDEQAAIPCHP